MCGYLPQFAVQVLVFAGLRLIEDKPRREFVSAPRTPVLAVRHPRHLRPGACAHNRLHRISSARLVFRAAHNITEKHTPAAILNANLVAAQQKLRRNAGNLQRVGIPAHILEPCTIAGKEARCRAIPQTVERKEPTVRRIRLSRLYGCICAFFHCQSPAGASLQA